MLSLESWSDCLSSSSLSSLSLLLVSESTATNFLMVILRSSVVLGWIALCSASSMRRLLSLFLSMI